MKAVKGNKQCAEYRSGIKSITYNYLPDKGKETQFKCSEKEVLHKEIVSIQCLLCV